MTVLDLLTYIVLILALVRLIISITNYFSRLYLDHEEIMTDTMISVLIPARNEALTLPALLESLDHSSYLNKEVLVFDDMSTDQTREILIQACQRYPWLRVTEGKNLPDGWTGKNHACFQLGKQASGEILLFLDADVILEPQALQKAVTTFQKEQLDLLSVFPQQIMKSTGEKLTVPLMNWILLSLLPMKLVKNSRQSSLAAANGQFMMFRAASYHQYQWHQRFRHAVVEDIQISRALKKHGLMMMTYLGYHDIYCRMYANGNEAIRGFSKNIHQFFGGSYLLMICFIFLCNTGFIWVYLTMPIEIFWGYIAVLSLTTLSVSYKSKQSMVWGLMLQPARILILMILGMKSLKNLLKRKTHWKERDIIIR